MPTPRRVPWFAVDIDLRISEKVASLPSDSARYGWIVGILAEAKRQNHEGRFVSKAHAGEVVGRFARYIDAYVNAGLIEVAPKLCDRCAVAFPDVPRGTVVVHDWFEHQRVYAPMSKDRDATPGAERTAKWRQRTAIFERDDYTCRYCGIDDYPRGWLVADHIIPVGRPDSTDDDANLATACRGCNKRKGDRTPDEAGMPLLPIAGDTSRDASHVTDVTRHIPAGDARHLARARATTSTGTPTKPLEEDRSPARDPDDADDIEPTMDDVVDALKARGYRRVTAPQRRLLAEVIDREGWTTVIAWIQTAPDDIDPIEHVKVVSNAGRTQRVTAARRREADHERTKSDEPGPIASALASSIGAGVTPPRPRANGLSRDETIAKFAAFRGVIPDDALVKQLAGHGLTMADLEGA